MVSRDGGDAAPYFVCNTDHTSDGAVFANDVANWDETVWAGSAADLTTPATLAWNDAIDNCLALNYAGNTDWRLPAAIELLSIYDFGNAVGPCSYPEFTNCINAYYWSSSTRAVVTSQAAALRFSTSGWMALVAKTTEYDVRPVRGGIVNG